MTKKASIFGTIIALNLYLSSGIALTGVSFSILLGQKPELGLFAIIFFATFSLYSLNRLTDKAEDAINNPARVLIIQKYEKPLLATAIIAYVLAMIIAWQRNTQTFLVLVLILLIGVLYSVKINPMKRIIGHFRLKDIFAGKNMTIATNWILAMVFIPYFYYYAPFGIATIILAIFIFFRSIINTVLFDLGDIEGDKRQKIKTIPIRLGSKKTIQLFYVLNTVLGLMIFVAASYGVFPPIAHVINVSTLLVYAYLFLLDKPKIIQQRTLLDWVVDGEYLLIGASILIATIL